MTTEDDFQAGWYWFRASPHAEWRCVLLTGDRQRGRYLRDERGGPSLETWRAEHPAAEWCGPLVEPVNVADPGAVRAVSAVIVMLDCEAVLVAAREVMAGYTADEIAQTCERLAELFGELAEHYGGTNDA